MSGQPPPPGGGYNPGAFEFRPGQSFVPRGQQQQAPAGQYDPYAMYGQQQQYGGGYPQQGYGGGYGGAPQQPYGYGGQQGYPSQQQAFIPSQPQSQQSTQQRAFVPGQRQTFVPPQASRPVQGFQPPTLRTAEPAEPRAPPTISLGGARAPASISIGGGGAKAAPSLSIGGSKPAAAKKEEKKEDEPAEKSEVKEEAKASSAPSTNPETAPSPAPDAKAPDTDASVKVIKSETSGTATPTNFSKVSAKTNSETIAKEQAAAGEEALRELYGDEVKDTNAKQHLNIIFAGQVDSGKSTTAGQLLVLSDAVDPRTLEKYQQDAKAAGTESWYLSWVLDSGKEERNQGKTVETGRAYFETEKKRYTILDAPGHASFLSSMITGAAQADLAVLVLSARKGEFESGFEKTGSTREHALLLRNAGCSKLVLAVNKMDDPTVEWSKERFDEIQTKITPYLKTLGFNPKTDLTFIPISAQLGQNMKEPVDQKLCSWYQGSTLLNHLDDFAPAERELHKPFMMPLSERYVDVGTCVMGKAESGWIKKGQKLLLMPNRNQVEVVNIMTEQGDEMEMAYAGENIRLRIKGVAETDISPGMVLSTPQAPVKVASAFQADISILDVQGIVANGHSSVIHIHTAAQEVVLTSLVSYFDKKTRKRSKKPPAFGKTGMMVRATFTLSAPLCLEKFADYKMLGRFSLRDQSKTWAIGKVVKLLDKDNLPDVGGLKVE